MIIGITGLKGSGKTTATNYFKMKYNYKEYSLAEPLKQIAILFGFTNKQVYGSQKDKLEINKKWNICSREFLQKFGTEICREQLPLVIPNMNLGKSGIIWVRLMEHFLNNHNDKHNDNIIVSDVRFIDEAQTIKQYENSYILKIVRDDILKDDFSNHSSELSLDIFDFIIQNNGSLEDFYNKLDTFVMTCNNL